MWCCMSAVLDLRGSRGDSRWQLVDSWGERLYVSICGVRGLHQAPWLVGSMRGLAFGPAVTFKRPLGKARRMSHKKTLYFIRPARLPTRHEYWICHPALHIQYRNNCLMCDRNLKVLPEGLLAPATEMSAASTSGAVADRIQLWERRSSAKGQEATPADEHKEAGHRPNLSTSSDSSERSSEASGPPQWQSQAAQHADGLLLDAQELRGIELIAGATPQWRVKFYNLAG